MIEGAHFQNLLQLERLHLATIDFGTGPFWVEHCGIGDIDTFWGDWRRLREVKERRGWERSINRR